VSGRKLPTAYTSQQIPGRLKAKTRYFPIPGTSPGPSLAGSRQSAILDQPDPAKVPSWTRSLSKPRPDPAKVPSWTRSTPNLDIWSSKPDLCVDFRPLPDLDTPGGHPVWAPGGDPEKTVLRPFFCRTQLLREIHCFQSRPVASGVKSPKSRGG